MRRLLAIAGLTLAVACAAPEQRMEVAARAGPDRAAVGHAVAKAADQIRRCYRSPRISSAGRSIVTVLSVHYAPDGTLAEVPTLVRQSGTGVTNVREAALMEQAAISAILRCNPLNLPPELYAGGWDEFELTFSPRGLA